MIRAIHYTDRDEWLARKTPGSFYLSATGGDTFGFWYFCPCGCGVKGRLLIGDGFKPKVSEPSWGWNGSRTEPELTPSVHHVGHWHGWLRGGYWESC